MTNIVEGLAQLPHPVRAIAIAPTSGLVADAVGIELPNRGYPVVDAQRMSSLLMRADLSEVELLAPQNLAALAEQGIDAVLLAPCRCRLRWTS